MIKSIAVAHADGVPFTDDQTIAAVARMTDTVLLSFSRGKDSIAAWLILRRHFARVIPYFQYIVPDLRFVNESLDYFESFFQTKIYRVPHNQFYDMLREAVFQPPSHLPGLNRLDLPAGWSDDDCAAAVMLWAGVSPYTWVAHGIRANDSLARRAWYKRHGPINWKRRTFAPVAGMSKAQLVDLIRSEGVKLPVDYRLFGCSFDGIDHKFIGPIKQYFPDDYDRIRDWFPLVDLELLRYRRLNRATEETA